MTIWFRLMRQGTKTPSVGGLGPNHHCQGVFLVDPGEVSEETVRWQDAFQ